MAIGAVDTLFELLRTHAGDEEVQENGLWAVGNIARHLEELKGILFDEKT